MNTEQPIRLEWFKSSHSSGEGGACVEVAADTATIHVRDSKNHTGPHLTFPRPAWTHFLAHLDPDHA
jgi:hypothetical protein